MGENIAIGSIVWGVRNIEKAVSFWSQALDYRLKYPASEDWAVLVPKSGEGIQLSLSKITSPRAKRHRMDLFTPCRDQEVRRLLSLGAVRAEWMYPPEADYTVLLDPDGNPFCVVQKEPETASQTQRTTNHDT